MKVSSNKTPEHTTKAICNKGFSGNSSILPRINFGVDGQEIARNPRLRKVSNR